MKKLVLLRRGMIALLMAAFGVGMYAQTPSDEEAVKQANNPLASLKSINLHNYYMPNLYGVPDAAVNQTWLRYAQPIGPLLIRVSMPFQNTSFPNEEPTTGLGDLNAFLIYKFSKPTSGTDIGVGPAFTFPTGTNGMGADKWQAGVSAIAFNHSNPVVQVGSLITWQQSFAGDEDKADVSMLTPQLFFMFQLGKGTYLRSTGLMTFNLKNGDYNVPVGLGIGKVIKSKNAVFNVFMEPQYSMLVKGMGQPQLQVFVGFNTQFH